MRNIGDEMNGFPIILFTIITGFILLGVLVALLIWKRRSKGIVREPDYRAFLIMGICFLPMGLLLSTSVNPGFIGFAGLGVAYMAIGLANRDKW